MARPCGFARVSAATLLILIVVACVAAVRGHAATVTALLALPWILLYLDMADAFLPVATRWRGGRATQPATGAGWRAAAGVAPHAFVCTVHELGDAVDEFIARHVPLRDAFWIVDLDSRDSTARRLRAAGWRCAGAAPGTARAALAALVAELPAEIGTVILVEDGATLVTPVDDPAGFARVLADFQRGELDALCPRSADAPADVAALFAAAESTRAAGIARSLGDAAPLTATAVYRRDLLQRLLADAHGDTRADSLRALALGARIRCDERFAVLAPVRGFADWFDGYALAWRRSLHSAWRGRRDAAAAAHRDFPAFVHYLARPVLVDLLAAPLRPAAAAILLLGGVAACAALAGVPIGGALADPRMFAWVTAQYVAVYAICGCLAARPGRRALALLLAPASLCHVLVRAFVPLAPLLHAGGSRVAR
ncbi:MAG TPA: hypothetical protein VMF52_06715 [Steroidobacteraceae bacterium]|nr:hypothetical protein [Steroidobacteraceae bacterium]